MLKLDFNNKYISKKKDAFPTIITESKESGAAN